MKDKVSRDLVKGNSGRMQIESKIWFGSGSGTVAVAVQ